MVMSVIDDDSSRLLLDRRATEECQHLIYRFYVEFRRLFLQDLMTQPSLEIKENVRLVYARKMSFVLFGGGECCTSAKFFCFVDI